MRKQSTLNAAWIAGLLLVLIAGLSPASSLAAGAETNAGPARTSAAGPVAVPAEAPLAESATPAQATPAGVDAGWWATVQEDIRRSEYHVTWQEQTYLDDVPAAYQAPNRAQNLRTYFTPEGLVVIPRLWAEESASPPWRWQARLSAWGREGALEPLPPPELEALEDRIEYRRGDPPTGATQGLGPSLVEWYRNDEEGLQQGFTLLSPPEGGQLGRPLQLELALGGDLVSEMIHDGAEIEFRAGDGSDGLRYGGLWAVDANGESLPAWLGLQGATLSIWIEDAGAAYPVEVAPAITGLPPDADWSIAFGQLGAEFGLSVATAGDVDGDGYSEVIVGAPNFDGGLAGQGYAYVYYGSREGLYQWPDWFETIGQAGAHYGGAVATAGDVNGDGFADVIVGAPGYTNGAGQAGEGGTWVYHGSDEGLSDEWSTHDESNLAGAAFGLSVATAGDVNGDGYSDVIVGAPLYEEGESEEGWVWVWHGSEEGLGESHAWHAQANLAEASFGQSVATAGDVNRDGYADVIVGASRYTSGEFWEGAAFVWLGSERVGLNGGVDGTPANAHRHLQIDRASARFGWSVSTAGDVNGDGYADVIVGAPYYTNNQAQEGGAWLYLGSDTGLSASFANQDEGNQDGAHFGYSVATAGDVNGDGRADVIVGAPDYRVSLDRQGRAWLWYGQATVAGISTLNDWRAAGEATDAFFGKSVATAGDVNGDGYSDVIIGAPSTDDPPGESTVYVYHGAPDGLEETATWTKPSNLANALFGLSVSTAGDVNGDGFADVIVGSPRWNGEGQAWVYHGTATGLSTAPAWYKPSGNNGAEFGAAVGMAGDVNGDGYGDVIVGAPGWLGQGAAFVYRGSADGLLSAPLWSKASNQAGSEFGTSVGSAGDVNGDGYADIVVGAPKWQQGGGERGGVWLYYGSDGGPHIAPDWHEVSDRAGAEYGFAVGTAGDVNGDGYSDVIVGAPFWEDDANTNEGRAWVYLGSATGLRHDLHWHAEGNSFGARLGHSVGTAGDVNGDGYADVIVGAPYFWDAWENEGRVLVFHGSALGLEPNRAWYKDGGQSSAHYGWSVGTAGDVNGDGYADVIIGVEAWNGGLTDEGGASVYHGSSRGLEDTRAWHGESDQTSAHYGYSVATAGDVNGDGYADVIVGAPNYETSSEKHDEGQAFLYYGNKGPGVNLQPRQQHSGGAALAHLGRANDLDQFRISLRAGTPFGRGRIVLECEVKMLGSPFTGFDTQSWGDNQNAVPGQGKYIVPHDLAAGTPYRWRMRWRYDPATTPWMPASRWVTVPWNGWNEMDLRTSGDRVLLPIVLRNYD